MNRRQFLKLAAAIPAVALFPALKIPERKKPAPRPEQWITVLEFNAGTLETDPMLKYKTPWECIRVAITGVNTFWAQNLDQGNTVIVFPHGERILSMKMWTKSGAHHMIDHPGRGEKWWSSNKA